MMNRRQYARTGLLAGGALASGALRLPAWGARTRTATDIVQLGPDKIKLTRLAIGTGTRGGSLQRELGVQGVADLLQFGYDQGLIFWDSADAYKTHPHLKEALKRIPREKLTIMTKTPKAIQLFCFVKGRLKMRATSAMNLNLFLISRVKLITSINFSIKFNKVNYNILFCYIKYFSYKLCSFFITN